MKIIIDASNLIPESGGFVHLNKILVNFNEKKIDKIYVFTSQKIINKLKIKNKKIISHMNIHIPTYHPNNIPKNLKKIKITKPGSRFLK